MPPGGHVGIKDIHAIHTLNMFVIDYIDPHHQIKHVYFVHVWMALNKNTNLRKTPATYN